MEIVLKSKTNPLKKTVKAVMKGIDFKRFRKARAVRNLIEAFSECHHYSNLGAQPLRIERKKTT